jgi:hypothetical protein
MGGVLSSIFSSLLGLLDRLYFIARFAPRRPRYFKDGWGEVETAQKYADVAVKYLAVGLPGALPLEPVSKTLKWGDEYPTKLGADVVIARRGSFKSPLHHVLPEPARICYFVVVCPASMKTFPWTGNSSPSHPLQLPAGVSIVLPAIGEHGSGARVAMAELLASESNVASIIITAPFYGQRKPQNQPLHYVRTVGDFWNIGTAIMEEAALLACWAADQFPLARMCTTGFSWGGAMASCTALIASQWLPQDSPAITVAPYAGSATPSVILEGILEDDIDWAALGGKKKARPTLAQIFDTAHLRSLSQAILSNSESAARLGGVHAVSFRHDSFVNKSFSEDLFECLSSCCYPGANKDLSWKSGGHITAFFTRYRYHVQAIRAALHLRIPESRD